MHLKRIGSFKFSIAILIVAVVQSTFGCFSSSDEEGMSNVPAASDAGAGSLLLHKPTPQEGTFSEFEDQKLVDALSLSDSDTSVYEALGGKPVEPGAEALSAEKPTESSVEAKSVGPPASLELPPSPPPSRLAAGLGKFRDNPLRQKDLATDSTLSETKAKRATSKSKSKVGYSKKEPFDPVKANGPIFVGWPKPLVALVITGRQDGYLEPCGCAGLDRMKGGFSRRYSLFQMLRKKGWPVVGIDVGGLCKGFGRQAELKFHTTVEAMSKMQYDAIGFGTSDLRFPAAELVSVAASTDDVKSPFTSANVGLFGFDSGITSPYKVVDISNMKIGVVSVIGKKYQREINNDEIEFSAPEDALAKVLPKLRSQKCNLLVLLAYTTRAETIELAKRFPEFALVVVSDGAPEPPPKPEFIEGMDTMLVEVGEKGMDAIVLGLYDDPKNPSRYQRVPLDSRFPQTNEMRLIMAAYQDQLKELGFEGLGLRAVPHPRRKLLGEFVGSKECAKCHEEEYDIWKKTGHAKAYSTLVELDPPRNFDPECISCHVIGWHPTQYFPYEGGFLSAEETPKMVDVGCENCHGPGSAHVEAELGSDEELKEKLREATILTKDEAKKRHCMSCHDLDNSPDFNFDIYWPNIAHGEDAE